MALTLPVILLIVRTRKAAPQKGEKKNATNDHDFFFVVLWYEGNTETSYVKLFCYHFLLKLILGIFFLQNPSSLVEGILEAVNIVFVF